MRTEEEINTFFEESYGEWSSNFTETEVIDILRKMTPREIRIVATATIIPVIEWVLGKDKDTMLWEIENA